MGVEIDGGFMAGHSTKTTVIGLRIPNDVLETVKRRMAKGNYKTVQEYLGERLIYDIMRRHDKRKEKPNEE